MTPRARNFSEIFHLGVAVKDNFAQLVWMTIICVTLGEVAGSFWFYMSLMGVEIVSFSIHQRRHHSEHGWFADPAWILVGLFIAVFASVVYVADQHPADPLMAAIIGTQIVSFAIHHSPLTDHRPRLGWLGSVPIMAIGFLIAAAPLFF